jgi:hypothetical protein
MKRSYSDETPATVLDKDAGWWAPQRQLRLRGRSDKAADDCVNWIGADRADQLRRSS